VKNASHLSETNKDQTKTIILKNLNFTIQPKQQVALVGPTGCGKTTLIKLLLRLYQPLTGQIFIDEQPIDTYPVQALRKAIGYIEQDTFLFSKSIAENIKFGHPEATLEDVIEVAKMAQVHDFVQNFSDGYDTVIGERGTRLSGGERQRIAIARALLTDPEIIVLDDSMSAIDSETEAKIGKAIAHILKDRTTIIITHRLYMIRNSDTIIVLKNGQILNQGSHSHLLQTSPEYRKIFTTSADQFPSEINQSQNNTNIISDNKWDGVDNE
jgi:ATP-binding cassette subfamily B protein/subfamily B ATP-binding cassette protein MsbA